MVQWDHLKKAVSKFNGPPEGNRQHESVSKCFKVVIDLLMETELKSERLQCNGELTEEVKLLGDGILRSKKTLSVEWHSCARRTEEHNDIATAKLTLTRSDLLYLEVCLSRRRLVYKLENSIVPTRSITFWIFIV